MLASGSVRSVSGRRSESLVQGSDAASAERGDRREGVSPASRVRHQHRAGVLQLLVARVDAPGRVTDLGEGERRRGEQIELGPCYVARGVQAPGRSPGGIRGIAVVTERDTPTWCMSHLL